MELTGVSGVELWTVLPYASLIIGRQLLFKFCLENHEIRTMIAFVLSPANVAGLGRSRSDITSSIYDSTHKSGCFSRAAATYFLDGQRFLRVHRVHDIQKHGLAGTNSQ